MHMTATPSNSLKVDGQVISTKAPDVDRSKSEPAFISPFCWRFHR